MRISRLVLSVAALTVMVTAPLMAQATPQRAVLVTGASTGIGRTIAERLAREGFYVYAGARQADDIAALSKIPNMKGVRLDVTSTADIAAFVQTVQKDGKGLYGVVNNAGVATGGPLINTDDEELRRVLDVNVMGPLRVTRGVAPLLIASKGRVVTISSISGVLSGAMLGVYSMSKHAVEAFGDALGAEMAPLGVTSSLIEPGNYRSEIGRNTMTAAVAAADRAKGTPFEAAMQNFVRAMGNYDNYPPPDSVAAAALHAFTAPQPRVRYMVVPMANQATATIRKAMDELVQLNHGQQFAYDREALIKMLDEALARVQK
ncbi:MAG: SDR family NAD(P)-dependent oxidoreductase [Gemmatimonadaceae bacterium]|nr:SDR family NAD(P)-dependent oxidoreductase [Gemmatimonadaceae bacterium]